MWSRYDTTAETAGILSGKVWNLDVWLEQAVSADGKTTQPRTGRRRLRSQRGSRERELDVRAERGTDEVQNREAGGADWMLK